MPRSTTHNAPAKTESVRESNSAPGAGDLHSSTLKNLLEVAA
jgi:hypothetical protein